MDKNTPFSLCVMGKGRLLAMFITEGMQSYPKSTWYDFSDEVTDFIKQEVALGEQGYIREEDKPMLSRAKRNVAKPPKTDVTVSFKYQAGQEYVTVASSKTSAKLSFTTHPDEVPSIKIMESYTHQIVMAISAVL